MGSALIIDDSVDLRVLLKQALELEGHEVQSAESGEEACQMLRDGARPGVILLDLMMPGMGGIGFLQWFETQKELSQIPIVVLSATNLKTEIKGVQKCLRKPVELPELLDLVAEHTRGH